MLKPACSGSVGGRTLEESRTPVLISHNGNQIAFFGCNKAGPESTWAREDRPGSNPCDEETFAVVSQLNSSGYLTFFTYQWYEHYRSSPDNTQRAGFQRAVDAGAAVVSGSQAHQPMGFEFYNQASSTMGQETCSSIRCGQGKRARNLWFFTQSTMDVISVRSSGQPFLRIMPNPVR